MIEPRRGSISVEVERARRGARSRVRDRVAAEEPMEIRLVTPTPSRTHQVAVTMRTPGDDFELAAGFLFAEGFVKTPSDIATLSYCAGPESQEYNVISVELRPGVGFDPALLARNFYTTSSCGVCGKASLDSIEVRGAEPFAPEAGARPTPELLQSLPAALRQGQGVFDRTGGIHAAAIVGADGGFQVLCEDVGRHNAVDKAVGHEFLAGRLPATNALLLVSGRSSFEIVQKALTAGIPTIAAVGAPSSLAVALAQRFGMTLIGFLRGDGFNIYTGRQRVGGDR